MKAIAHNRLPSTITLYKGFYWTPLLQKVGTYLRDDEERNEKDIGAALCGLIKYKLKKLKDFQNIRDDDDKFSRKLSAKEFQTRFATCCLKSMLLKLPCWSHWEACLFEGSQRVDRRRNA